MPTDAEIRAAIRVGLVPNAIATLWPKTRGETVAERIAVLRQVIRVARALRFHEVDALPNIAPRELDHARYMIGVLGG